MSRKRFLKLIFLVVLLIVVSIFSVNFISRKDFSISLELGSRNADYLHYNNELLLIKGYVIKLPFNLSITKGEATIAEEVWNFKDYNGLRLPEEETLYFRPNRVHNKIMAVKIFYLMDGATDYSVKITHKENTFFYEVTPHN